MTQEELLKRLYFDPSGFMSVQKLYKEAKQQDKAITQKIVKDWYDKNVGKTKYKGTNSFVAPEAHYEYQIDLFFINDLKNRRIR